MWPFYEVCMQHPYVNVCAEVSIACCLRVCVMSNIDVMAADVM